MSKEIKNFVSSPLCRELTRNSQPMRNKNKENTCQRKTIIRTKQYLRGLAICLHLQSCKNFTIIRKKYKCDSTMFQSLKTTITNPNYKSRVFYLLRIRFTSAPAWACRPKPPLYRLSFKKSPIKNHTTLFRLDRVVNQIKHN